MLDEFGAVERRAAKDGLSFGEAMRLLAGAHWRGRHRRTVDARLDEVVAGPWLAKTLHGLRDPDQLARVDPASRFQGTLRPYQQTGVRWLHLLARLGSAPASPTTWGSARPCRCLSLLLVLKSEGGERREPSLLVAPASLLANWAAEIERFAPTPQRVHRSSVRDAGRN